MGIGKPMVGRYFAYDALNAEYQILAIEKNPDCPLCGTNPVITAPGQGELQ
jgi:hypothetical protein